MLPSSKVTISHSTFSHLQNKYFFLQMKLVHAVMYSLQRKKLLSGHGGVELGTERAVALLEEVAMK